MIIRVFARRTSYTPVDEWAFVGDPPLWKPDQNVVIDVSVSVCFSWDIVEGQRLVGAWRNYYPVVRIGGPAFGNWEGSFTPGLYVKQGVTFTSRGCPRRCPFCLVPEREGALQLLPIQPGHIVNDNNILACPPAHRLAVWQMLGQQRKAAVFAGGLDARLVTDEIADELRGLRIQAAFLAADTDAALPALRKAAGRLAFLGRGKLRCYVLCAFDGETIPQAEARLEAVWDAGCMPFCQLWQPHGPRRIDYGPEWRRLQKAWSRPALTKALHRQVSS